MTETTTWRGSSGSSYTYYLDKLPWQPSENQDGNYIFAKKINGLWHAVYVGQGDLHDRYDAAMREGCVTMKKATHYHRRINNDASARRAEENDIIAGNPECNWPNGCNGHD